MIVVDASAMVEMLLSTERGHAILARIISMGATIQAPHLLDVEVLNVVRRYTRLQTLSSKVAQQILSDYRDFPITRHPHDMLLDRIWELRHNLTAYDATYLALAEALDAPLATCDQALAAVPGIRAEVRLWRE